MGLAPRHQPTRRCRSRGRRARIRFARVAAPRPLFAASPERLQRESRRESTMVCALRARICGSEIIANIPPKGRACVVRARGANSARTSCLSQWRRRWICAPYHCSARSRPRQAIIRVEKTCARQHQHPGCHRGRRRARTCCPDKVRRSGRRPFSAALAPSLALSKSIDAGRALSARLQLRA